MNTAEMGFPILKKNPYKMSYLIVFELHRKVGSLFQTDIVLSMWWLVVVVGRVNKTHCATRG